MVRGLLPGFDLPQFHARVQGGGTQHLFKLLRGHEVAAGGGGKVSAPGQRLKGAEIDFLVALSAFFAVLRDLVKAGGSRMIKS